MAIFERSAQETEGRSQLLTFSRREFFGVAGLIALRQAPSQFVKIPPHLPVPEFSIGDKVASYWPEGSWEEESEEEPDPEIGEIAGICWHPIGQQWEYLVNWISGSGSDEMYPCFDEVLVEDAPKSPLVRVYAPN